MERGLAKCADKEVRREDCRPYGTAIAELGEVRRRFTPAPVGKPWLTGSVVLEQLGRGEDV